jgi:LysM repeat protein
MMSGTKVVVSIASVMGLIAITYYATLPSPSETQATNDNTHQFDTLNTGATPGDGVDRSGSSLSELPPLVGTRHSEQPRANTPARLDAASDRSDTPEPAKTVNDPLNRDAIRPMGGSTSSTAGLLSNAVRRAGLDEPDLPGVPARSESTPAHEPAPARQGPAGPDQSSDDAADTAPPDEHPNTPQPTPVPTQPRNVPAAAPTYSTYTVVESDTLSSIADDWFGDANKWDLIAKANPLVDPNRLKIGQVLRLPAKDATRPAAHPAPAATETAKVFHTVRSGDTLSLIADEYYGHSKHWRIIFDANAKTLENDPDRLKVGMKLVIPPRTNESD